MSVIVTIILTVQMLSALAMIGLILVQHGKGADMGAAFGSGSSGSLFGATGSANFLSRTTAVLAAIFFTTSLGLAYVATHRPKASGGVMDAVKEQPAAPAPSVPVQPDAAKSAVDSAGKAGEAGTSKANEVPK